MKASDLAGRIVTWKPDSGVGNLPDWLPLTFLQDWFRDRIQNDAEQESSVKVLCKELGIETVAEPVAGQVSGPDECRDEQAGKQREPPRLSDRRSALGTHAAASTPNP